MLVYNENQEEAFQTFKDACDEAKYVSFDCEMTGINLETKTDGTKYDTQEFRYYKQKQVVEQFDLIQIGFTFYIERIKEIIEKSAIEEDKEKKQEENNEKIIKKEYYLERTFVFYLFKNSKLKDIDENLFNSDLKAHPAALKFLNENNFDFNLLITKGLHYNKLLYENKIREKLNKEKFLFSNGAMFLSKENENHIIEKIISLAEYLLSNKVDDEKNKKEEFTIKFNNKRAFIFFLGCNFKKLLFLDNFHILKSKKEENAAVIKKYGIASSEKFNQVYTSFEGFKTIIKNTPNKIYQCRYQLGSFPDEDLIKELVHEELGFSYYIQYLANKKIPIIGHNIYFDMMFLYDKLIGDLPDDFYSFKKEIHKFFPYIYDTKIISSKLKDLDKGSLDKIYKAIIKKRFNIYVPFFQDAVNGFCIYIDEERDKLHDAGYDSIITGRSFILMNKALQNDYHITNVSKVELRAGDKKLDENKEINIKYGFIDKSLYKDYINISAMSLVESEEYASIKWDVDNQKKEEYIKGEQALISELFKNVFIAFFKTPEDGHIPNIYDIAYTFENDDYDILVVKSGLYSAFIEVTCDNYKHDEDYPKILKLIEDIKKNNKEKETIDRIMPAKEFYENYKQLQL